MNRDEAQAALNLYPDNSPFWDSPSGQEALELRDEFKLIASNTNKDRCRIHGALMQQARDSIK